MPAPVVDGASKPGPAELAKRNLEGKGILFYEAMKRGLPFDRFLEEEDPTADHGSDEILDAFGRQLKLANIRTVSDPAAGIWADEFSAFGKDEHTRALGLTWCHRRHREARFGTPANRRAGGIERKVFGRSVYTSADEGLNTIWRQFFDAAEERQSRVSAPVPLQRLVAQTTQIDTDSYRAAYMTEPEADEIRFVRVAELTDIPLAHITVGEQHITLVKYARGYQMSYESRRRMPLDKVALWINRNAIQQENDKVEQAADVLLNGDGNGNSATSYNLTTLDPDTTAGILTLKAWLRFKNRFNNDYQMVVALMREELKIELQLLDSGTANIPLAVLEQFGGFTELNNRLGDGVALGQLEVAPADKVIGIDTSAALEHVMEVGSEITEAEDFIRNQSSVVVMSEVEGFAVFDQRATRVLNVAA